VDLHEEGRWESDASQGEVGGIIGHQRTELGHGLHTSLETEGCSFTECYRNNI